MERVEGYYPREVSPASAGLVYYLFHRATQWAAMEGLDVHPAYEDNIRWIDGHWHVMVGDRVSPLAAYILFVPMAGDTEETSLQFAAARRLAITPSLVDAFVNGLSGARIAPDEMNGAYRMYYYAGQRANREFENWDKEL